MKQKGFEVTQYLPGFLLWELSKEGDNPLLQALDQFCQALGNTSMHRSLALAPELGEQSLHARILKGFGLRSDALTAVQRDHLFQMRTSLARARGSLRSVEILASVYFGEHRLTRGGAPTGSALRDSSVTLTDGAGQNVVLIKLGRDYSSDLVKEFRVNAAVFLPPPAHIVVDLPRTPRERPTAFRLAPFAIKEWRLPCPTSRR